ncbi:uncharacterized protein LOC134806667 [Cydia splendana]|uniref:uncharacterized protein LOC134806667 n=1 Tax=Cydia splendana TaxID=1100963 RepID=UPI00300C7232
MNNDMKLYPSTNFRNENGTGDSMWNALTLIANEIQKFRLESEAGKNPVHKNDAHFETFLKTNATKVLTKATNCSNATNVDTKNSQLKKLKEHLRTVCDIAKIVLSAKNNETESLMNKLKNLSRINAENLSLIQQLRMENYNTNNDVQFLSNFIHMAYQKLQKMRNEIPRDMPFMEELKIILLACGQYYLDYCNARDQCAQLKQRNRFLTSKLNIVENNLAATTEGLRNLRNINMKLKIKCDMHQKHGKEFSKKLVNVKTSVNENIFLGGGNKSDYYGYNAGIPKDVECKQNINISNKSLCLTSHFETVNNLLLDQDIMLKELKKLYLEVRRSCN